MILLKYEMEQFQALNSNCTTFILTVESRLFWFFRRVKEIKYDIPEHCNTSKFIEHWDDLIQNKKKLKL